MGEIAEAMLSGLFCEGCGELLDGEEPGYVRRCEGCKLDEPPALQPKTKKTIDAAERERRRKRNLKNKERRRRRRARLRAEREAKGGST